jgi:hypothetical protein
VREHTVVARGRIAVAVEIVTGSVGADDDHIVPQLHDLFEFGSLDLECLAADLDIPLDLAARDLLLVGPPAGAEPRLPPPQPSRERARLALGPLAHRAGLTSAAC